jgi:O-antigen ligase
VERTNTYLNDIAFALLMLFAFVMLLSNALAEILIALMIVIWVAQTLAYRRKDWLDYPLFKPIAAYIGYKIVVLIASGYHGTFGLVLEQLVLPILYFMVPTIVVTYERRRKVVWLLIAGAVVAAGVGIIKYILQAEERVSSIVSGTSTFSFYLAVIMGIVFSIFVFSKQIREKVFMGLVSIPLILGIVLSFTRASYLAAAAFTAFLGIFKDRRLLILIVMVAGGIYVFQPRILSNIDKRFDTANTHKFYSHRDVLTNLALSKAEEIRFLGFGINSFPELVDVENNPDFTAKTINNWHNMYLEALYDGGPFALIFLLWIFYTQTRYSFARFRKTRNDEHKMYQLSFLILIFCMLVIGCFMDPMRDPIISMLFWMYLGLSLI